MLRFREIRIKDFVLFTDVRIEPSVSAKKPLTIIRAENASGKTTLLRAIRWGMYGEEGLPGIASRFPIHPADWKPDDKGRETSVTIVFETDGSTRNHPTGNPFNTTYQLHRSAKTFARKPNINGEASIDGEPDFRRDQRKAHLMVEQPDGSWEPAGLGVDTVIRELLPSDLRDFFVMDADEATDFVGGSESDPTPARSTVDKTSYAVRALLGLNVFEKATKRLTSIAAEFGREATKAVDDEELNKWQEDLERLKIQVEAREHTIAENRRALNEVARALGTARARLETLIGKVGAHEELRERLKRNRKRSEIAREERREAVRNLSAKLTGVELLASVSMREVSKVRALLQPLYDNGTIPVRHLVFVQHLLEEGTCVCGRDLTPHTEHWETVRQLIAGSRNTEVRADKLSQVLQAAKLLDRQVQGSKWADEKAELEVRLARLDEELSELRQEKKDIDRKLDEIDIDEVQVVRREIDMLLQSRNQLQRAMAIEKRDLKQDLGRLHELEGKVRDGRNRRRAARELGKCEDTAKCLVTVLERAFARLRDDQVSELSAEMNDLFEMMAANVVDDNEVEEDRPKATLRMIEQVGLQQMDGTQEDYEIFAKNGWGRSMPPTEINGASRRILALSFVLGLCTVSRTRAPLVADSLLNFLSGVVRTNTLRITATTASQPILLLTGSDLASQSEVDLVSRYAGATYTLTAQSQHTGLGGDVVNLTVAGKVSLLCRCGPREFCTKCERRGQADQADWVRRVREDDLQ